MEQVITDRVTEQDRLEIFEKLLAYNLKKLGDQQPRPLAVFLKNESGEKTAGLIGQTFGNWLTATYLWVQESERGKGLGSQILQSAEGAAKTRGCRFAFLDTFDFQAPAFYRRRGYQEVFALETYPLTGKRHYFTKRLV